MMTLESKLLNMESSKKDVHTALLGALFNSKGSCKEDKSVSSQFTPTNPQFGIHFMAN